MRQSSPVKKAVELCLGYSLLCSFAQVISLPCKYCYHNASLLRFLSESDMKEMNIIIRQREGMTKLKRTLKYLYLFLVPFCKRAIGNHNSLE